MKLISLILFLVSIAISNALYSPKSTKVTIINSKDDFKKNVMNNPGIVFVEFYAPWCGHCKSLAPEWEKAAKALQGVVTVAAVDATAVESLAQKYQIQGFPSIKVFGADKRKPVDYQGAREAKAIVSKAMSMAKSLVDDRLGGKPKKKSKKDKKSKSKKSKSKKGVVTLTESNFNDSVLGSDDMWLVEFYAPWCGHCKKLEPEWKAAAKELADSGIQLGAVDATSNENLARQFEVRGYPTIKWFGPGGKTISDAKDYQGPREADGIVGFALDTFEKLGGAVEPLELLELTQASIFSDQCSDGKKTCVVAVVPDILDGGAAERNSLLDKLKSTMASSNKFGKFFTFSWTAANLNQDLEAKFRVESFPALIAINKGKSAFAFHKGAFSPKAMSRFLEGVMHGNGGVKKFRGELPAINTVPAWDGKDGVLEVLDEEEFDLEAFLSDEL